MSESGAKPHAYARVSEARAARLHCPATAIRRLRELNAEVLDLGMQLVGAPGWLGLVPVEPAIASQRAELDRRQREAQEEIAHLTSLLERDHVLATEQAPRPMERVTTQRGPAITVKTTATTVRIKQGGRAVSVARDRVWVPRSALALRAEHPLSRDEALVLWRAQHENKVVAYTIEQYAAIESLVDRGLLVPHPDLLKSGIFLVTNRGRAIELPEGKPRTWLSRWDGLEAKAASDPPERREPSRSKPRPTPEDAERFAEQIGLKPCHTVPVDVIREALVHAVREGLGPQMMAWFVGSTRVDVRVTRAVYNEARGVVARENEDSPPSWSFDQAPSEKNIRTLVNELELLPEVAELIATAKSRVAGSSGDAGGRHPEQDDRSRGVIRAGQQRSRRLQRGTISCPWRTRSVPPDRAPGPLQALPKGLRSASEGWQEGPRGAAKALLVKGPPGVQRS
ncbi:MAG: hypothetical protein AB1Z98_13040 [Nannocystaceae bacterium]